MPEKLAALRYLGLTLLWQGHLAEARPYLEEVLRTYDPNRDREAQFRFGTDSLASATIYLLTLIGSSAMSNGRES